MRTLAELELLPVWVNPTHLVSTAVHVMEGHGLKALAVLDAGELVGVLSLDTARTAPPNSIVEAVLQQPERILHIDMSVRQAADIFIQRGLTFAPVMGPDGYVGVLTASNLLREFGRSLDPLTGLPWSDALRSWGFTNLRAGREITIMFLDVDAFGAYNKRHGHIIGDRILKAISGELVNLVDQPEDVIVRYGGDEFAIGTLRDRATAEKLAKRVEEECRKIQVEGVPEGVTVSVGVSGGKRTKERDNVHYAATLDNLINLASKDCLAKKVRASARREADAQKLRAPETAAVAAEAVPEPQRPDAGVMLVSLDENNPSAPTTVSISLAEHIGTGVDVRGKKTTLQSVVRAAANAIERLRPGVELFIDDVVATESGDNTEMITVVARLAMDGKEFHAAATVAAIGEPSRAAAEALLEAYRGLCERSGTPLWVGKPGASFTDGR